MNEQEWLNTTEPFDMLDYLQGIGSRRKCLLFACACERRLWDQPDCERDKVTAAERYADGDAPAEELFAALEAIGYEGVTLKSVTEMDPFEWAWDEAERSAEYAAKLARRNAKGKRRQTSREERARQAAYDAELAEQCALLRDIFGNPFRPTTLKPGWQTPAVIALAQSIYEERRFDELSVLADALEEAGCTDGAILSHCREPGDHVRGCWVLDLILGRE
jgi:hypothetical protein